MHGHTTQVCTSEGSARLAFRRVIFDDIMSYNSLTTQRIKLLLLLLYINSLCSIHSYIPITKLFKATLSVLNSVRYQSPNCIVALFQLKSNLLSVRSRNTKVVNFSRKPDGGSTNQLLVNNFNLRHFVFNLRESSRIQNNRLA